MLGHLASEPEQCGQSEEPLLEAGELLPHWTVVVIKCGVVKHSKPHLLADRAWLESGRGLR